MADGWVKNHRKIAEWEWYTTPHMAHLWQHLIREANHKDGRWRGHEIKKGQLACGLHSLKSATGISIQSLRTCLARLEASGEITRKSTNSFTVITICKYCDYQGSEEDVQQTINKRSTNDQQTINNKQECKNVRMKEENKKEYGEFRNVKLSDDEFSKLSERFNGTLSARIERLSSYIASKGARYKSHYATILAWAQKDNEKAGTARSKKDEANDLREKWARELLDAEAGGGDEGVGDQIQRQAADASRDDIPCKRVLP